MSDASYERQHLALQAAGYISGDGATQTTFGCQMTRIAAGHYGLVLDANSGVVNDESFANVSVKGSSYRVATVDDTSNTLKSIKVFNPLSGSPADADIEVALHKSVTR